MSEPRRNVKRPSDDETPVVAGRSTHPPAKGALKTGGMVRAGLRSAVRMVQLVVGILVVGGASIAVAWGAREYVMTSPRFAIRTISVEGVARLTPAQVAEAGQLELGTNAFSVDLELAKSQIEAHPWVHDAVVTRKLPNTLEIAVVEQEAHALVVLGGHVYLASRDGDVFKELKGGDPSDLPVVTGIRSEMVLTDRPGMVLAIKRALDVADELERVGITELYPLQEVHLEDDGSTQAIVGREGIAIQLGVPPYRAKIAQAKRVFLEVRQRKANASVVFLDNDANPDRVVVRMH